MSRGTDPAELPDVAIEIVGRDDERARIDALLDGAAMGASGTIVVDGPPGIGKTALLEYAVHRAVQFRILRVAGVESEMAFGYAGVHQLVGPILDHIGALADPQRDALDAALGRVEHPEFDPFIVALAVLSLLAEAALAQPVLIVVDDAQWLDDESARAIAFVA
ncbi:MAG TPA: ATP-binding protein, partial [Ilumatobacteraceae bacterium]|nr:ATP-binding protein [Ilumatobacteraceae bacterium]